MDACFAACVPFGWLWGEATKKRLASFPPARHSSKPWLSSCMAMSWIFHHRDGTFVTFVTTVTTWTTHRTLPNRDPWPSVRGITVQLALKGSGKDSINRNWNWHLQGSSVMNPGTHL